MYIEFRAYDDVAWDCAKWDVARWKIFIRLKAQSIFRVATALRLGQLPRPQLFERLAVPAKEPGRRRGRTWLMVSRVDFVHNAYIITVVYFGFDKKFAFRTGVNDQPYHGDIVMREVYETFWQNGAFRIEAIPPDEDQGLPEIQIETNQGKIGMASIFLSYARRDGSDIERTASAIQRAGLEVTWDNSTPCRPKRLLQQIVESEVALVVFAISEQWLITSDSIAVYPVVQAAGLNMGSKPMHKLVDDRNNSAQICAPPCDCELQDNQSCKTIFVFTKLSDATSCVGDAGAHRVRNADQGNTFPEGVGHPNHADASAFKIVAESNAPIIVINSGVNARYRQPNTKYCE